MAESVRHALELVRDDAEFDAAGRVEFTPFGIGTTRGEMLAQIQALAKCSLTLLSRLEVLEQSSTPRGDEK